MKKTALLLVLCLVPLGAQEDQAEQVFRNGEGQVRWGANFDTVRESVNGRLQYYERNRFIVSREGEIMYTYGFFYPDPEVIGEELAADAVRDDNGEQADDDDGEVVVEAEYAYVILRFPYLALEDLLEKYTERYGEPTSNAVLDNKGVLVWENDAEMIAMWVDEYEGNPYSRKINYISKDFTEKLEDYRTRIFNQREIETLNTLRP